MLEAILHKELSYKIQGILIEVRRMFGPGHKEQIYCNVIEELLQRDNMRWLQNCFVTKFRYF
jgi:hypothetical protein